ncbi:MAG: peptidylprolyl isomerase [Eggerthellaceae bacterium]|nr:peptidylprolyl isomerase [Eggerthellaceae bacterium]MCH4221544.1 peptidylprolyl isomerase [Eggerthellaceae bacterium]
MKVSKLVRLVGTLGVTAVCAVGLTACASGSNGSSGVAATVNGTEIQEQTITDYIQNFRTSAGVTSEDDWGSWMAQYSTTPSAVREQVIDYYTGIELIKQAADQYDVTVSDDDVDAQVEKMKEKYNSDDEWTSALSSAGMTEDSYRSNVRVAMLENGLKSKVSTSDTSVSDDDLLTSVEQYGPYFSGAKRSSQILFDSSDTDTAQQVLDQINAGTLDFETAAKTYSKDTASAADGGDVGWDMLNSFVTEYTDALSGLSKGQVSGLVNSEYGIHIIKCTDEYTAPDSITSLDQVPTALVDYVRQVLQSQSSSQAYSSWYSDYKDQADIQVNDMPKGLPYDLDMSKYQESSDSSDSSSSDDSSSDSSSSDSSSSSTDASSSSN